MARRDPLLGDKVKKILSIDGGGIRGIVPAVVLTNLEKRIGKPCAQLFDLIAGTSTGGILALGLACPGKYSAEELVNLYAEHGRSIFSRGLWRWIASPLGVRDEKYGAAGLEAVLMRYFKTWMLSDATTKVDLTAYEIERRIPFFFRSWHAQWNPEYDFLMVSVARATSAAPTYFEPARIMSKAGDWWMLVDGGVAPLNNPALFGTIDAMGLWPEEEIAVVSIGTGEHLVPFYYNEARKWGLAGWARPLLEIIMQGQSMIANYHAKKLVKKMVRFQAELPAGLTRLDDASPANIAGLKEIGQRLIRSPQMRAACDLIGG